MQMNKELQTYKCAKGKVQDIWGAYTEKPDLDRRVRKDLFKEMIFTLRHEG